MASAASSSSALSANLKQQHAQLLQAFSASAPDLKAIGSQLTKLKVTLIQAGLLIPSAGVRTNASSSTSSTAQPASPEDLALARDILEIGAFSSIRNKDVASFDRYMDLLKAFYNDLSSRLPPSNNQQPLLGLSLLRLLSSNAIAAFHTTLETLPPALLRDSPYLQHPINLERWLMEGSYSKVWRSRDQVPREEYRFFVDGLMDTIRREIASCEEKAYDSLPLADAATLLFFSSLQDVSSFANERGWRINPSTQTVHFDNTRRSTQQQSNLPTSQAYAEQEANSDDAVPKRATIASNLHFARELESIV
ncbi:unnamed protein product [Parajaminaea phylloscopi]